MHTDMHVHMYLNVNLFLSMDIDLFAYNNKFVVRTVKHADPLLLFLNFAIFMQKVLNIWDRIFVDINSVVIKVNTFQTLILFA